MNLKYSQDRCEHWNMNVVAAHCDIRNAVSQWTTYQYLRFIHPQETKKLNKNINRHVAAECSMGTHQ